MAGVIQLNEQQNDIVEWVKNSRGSANVIARAGCGKTFTLVEGVVKTIVDNNLGTLVLMAFNKAAADEFKIRIQRLAQENDNPEYLNEGRVRTGTVHSIGYSFVRQGLGKVKVDGRKVGNLVYERGKDDTFYSLNRAGISKLVGLAKQVGLSEDSADDVWEEIALVHDVEFVGDELKRGIQAAQEILGESNRQLDVIDFDDMIYLPIRLGLDVEKFDWVLIDEAQDTNETRRALAVKMMMPGTGRLVAVGDDKQAIYGFTGADADSLNRIKSELNSQELPLTITYRCPKSVVVEANRIVPDLQAHESAPEGIVRYVEGIEQVELVNTDVILCRNTKPLVQMAYKLIRQGLPCKVEGREIGEGLVQLAERWKTVSTLGQLIDRVQEYQAREIEKFLKKKMEGKAQQVEDKCQTLIILAEALVKDGKNSVRELVEFIKGMFGDDDGRQVLRLSTIHKSKGREWDRVLFLDRRQTIPSKYAKQAWQLEQEFNLEYVGITRAKRELVYVGL